MKNSLLHNAPTYLLIVLSLWLHSALTVEQFTKAQCLQLEHELDKNRAIQRRGYSLRQATTLQATEEQLLQQLHYHCMQPQASHTPQPEARVLRSKGAATRPTHQPTFSIVSTKPAYQGAQLQAWLNYYREPRRCFDVRQTALIVACVEQRQTAMRTFERLWQKNQNLSDQ